MDKELDKELRIEGQQIYLRPITREDTLNIVRWRNSDAVRPFFIYQKPFTAEGHLKWLETEVETEKCYQFIVCLKEDDTPVGSTFLKDYEPEHRKAEYGIFLGSDRVKGRGIGTESLELTLRFAFENLKLHKVFSRIFEDNEVSIKTLLKCGFHQEGCLKQDVIVNGEYRDLVLLAILNPAEVRQE